MNEFRSERFAMILAGRWRIWLLLAIPVIAASLATVIRAQENHYPKPTDLPNPYRLVEGWPAHTTCESTSS